MATPNPKRNLIGAKLILPPKVKGGLRKRLIEGKERWKRDWRLTFEFDGHQFEARRVLIAREGDDPDLHLTMDGQDLLQVFENETQTITIAGESGDHSLIALNNRKTSEGEEREDGVGISLDGIPVHHTLFDPAFQLRQGLSGTRIFLFVVGVNLLYGSFLIYQHKAAFLAIQIAYGIPFLALAIGIGRFKRHHLAAMKAIYYIASTETMLYVLDGIFSFSGFAMIFTSWRTYFWIVMLTPRLTALALIARGVRASQKISMQDEETLNRLGKPI